MGDRLSTTLAVYELELYNRRTRDPLDPTITLLFGGAEETDTHVHVASPQDKLDAAALKITGLHSHGDGISHSHSHEHGPRTIDRLGFRKSLEHGLGDELHTTNTYYVLPEGLNKLFFTNSGSESVDSAMKIALAYHPGFRPAHRPRLQAGPRQSENEYGQGLRYSAKVACQGSLRCIR